MAGSTSDHHLSHLSPEFPAITPQMEDAAADEAVAVMKKPAAAGLACSKAPILSIRDCCKVLKRLKASSVVRRGEVQTLFRSAKRAAQSKRKEEQAKAAGLLGQVLAHVDRELEAAVQQALAEVDTVRADSEALATAQAEAEAHIGELKQEVAAIEAEIAEAEKVVESAKQAISATKTNKKSAVVEIKTVSDKKRQLEDAEVNIFRPLKEACVDKSGSKQLRQLCKIGEKHGLHRELLTIAPAVFKKQLDKRQTFDNLAVQSLGAEFDKHAKALSSKLQECEQVLTEKEQRLQIQQNEMLNAKALQKESRKKLPLVQARLEKGRELLTRARQNMRKAPKALKRVTCELESVQATISKFRAGPLATYERVLPLPTISIGGSADETRAEQ